MLFIFIRIIVLVLTKIDRFVLHMQKSILLDNSNRGTKKYPTRASIQTIAHTWMNMEDAPFALVRPMSHADFYIAFLEDRG